MWNKQKKDAYYYIISGDLIERLQAQIIVEVNFFTEKSTVCVPEPVTHKS